MRPPSRRLARRVAIVAIGLALPAAQVQALFALPPAQRPAGVAAFRKLTLQRSGTA